MAVGDPGGEGPAATDPALAAGDALAGEDDQAEEDEDQGEGAGGGRVEADEELGEDLGREGPEAEDLEGPVLGEHDQGDEEAAAEDRESGSGDGDPPERLEASEAEAPGDLLL